MTLYEATILGIVEGITEFLPVSSTAHIALASQIMDIPPYTPQGLNPHFSFLC